MGLSDNGVYSRPQMAILNRDNDDLMDLGVPNMFRQSYAILLAEPCCLFHRSNWPDSGPSMSVYFTEPDLLVIKHVLLNNPYVADDLIPSARWFSSCQLCLSEDIYPIIDHYLINFIYVSNQKMKFQI